MRVWLFLPGLFLLLLAAAPKAQPPGFALAVHGGAGWDPAQLGAAKTARLEEGLRAALESGRKVLASGGSSLLAVERAVTVLEDNPDFNAGKGSVLNEKGEIEMDASIMDGATLRCGAVGGVRRVRNPITLAHTVMTDSRHVLLMAAGAEQFGKSRGIELVDPSYFHTSERHESWKKAKQKQGGGKVIHPGTVGCVALDKKGQLAAATSTGGLTLKRFGRIGDSPIIGAGTYADDVCAVSCTGIGEEFIRRSVAYDVSARMRYGRRDLASAVGEIVTSRLPDDCGGLISVDRYGEIVMGFNTAGMARGAVDSEGRFEVAIGR